MLGEYILQGLVCYRRLHVDLFIAPDFRVLNAPVCHHMGYLPVLSSGIPAKIFYPIAMGVPSSSYTASGSTMYD